MSNYIKKEIIDRIYEEADLVKVISTKVELKKKGANYEGLSPFKEEKTPSFMVSPSKGIWKDFSTGTGGNSAVSFIEALGYPWIDAVKMVAEITGVILEYEEKEQNKEKAKEYEHKTLLSAIMQSAVRKFHEAFLALPEDHPAKVEVYEKRKYTEDIVDEYKIGYAPGGTFIYDLCVEKGLVTEAREIGLISDTKNHDFWVDRVVYPFITNSKSQPIVGLAGRKLSEDNNFPKWMNPKTSKLYDKSSFLYGLEKARQTIAKENEVWIVEGYNDVISFQANGLNNVVAPCGTAIADGQVRELKKLCNRVVLCMDGDEAGLKAMTKHIELFLKHDFRVFIQIDLDGLDPDDYVRSEFFNKETFLEDIQVDKKDAFKLLLDVELQGKDEIEKFNGAKRLFNIISNVSDDGMKTIYHEWLMKEAGVSKTNINAWANELEEEREIAAAEGSNGNPTTMYLLPKEVTTPLEKLVPTIEKYQMFQSDNKVYIMRNADQPPYTFYPVTNFEIKIIQHMQDEKFPKKLIWMRNVYGREVIFDCLSSEVNTPNSFENLVTNQGKYYWTGTRNDHQKLKIFLFESMGTGRMIEVLGWQPEGFWVWNNIVTVPETESTKATTIEVDENGVFKFKDVSYYVPSANRAYANNLYRYEAQKKVVLSPTNNTFQNYTSQMIKVHREHALMGILFTISSMFQDIVVSELGFFPMLFLYGPASSGKDQLGDCCQSFFGVPQTAINLEGGVSTIKAQVREFAQFSNLISHLSEYKNGDAQLDGVLKGLWDRRGYKRGNIDSHVGTESIPILSSVLLTGNFHPEQDALITRLIWNFMDKTVFTEDEIKEYEKLADMTKDGVSGLSTVFIENRSLVKKLFKKKHREFRATLTQRNMDANARMISNLSVLGAFYQIFADTVSFPFTMTDIIEHFDKTLEKQMNKLNSASVVNKFWECFLSSMRMGQKNDQIRVNRDYKIEGDKLYFNFTSCYNRVQRQWYSQYHEMAPGKSTMANVIKKDNSFLQNVSSTRMTYKGKEKVTSAYVVKLDGISVGEEIMNNMEFQLDEDGWEKFNEMKEESNSSKNPVTPIKNKNNGENSTELPF